MADAAVPGPSLDGILITEHEGYWELGLRPTPSFPKVMRQLQEVRVFCKDKKPARLMLDLRGIIGTFTVTDRYELGSFGGSLQGLVGRVAVIAQPEFIDPEKFGVQVAQNRGLNVDVFTSAEAALGWLLGS